jgi:hypothetical protein
MAQCPAAPEPTITRGDENGDASRPAAGDRIAAVLDSKGMRRLAAAMLSALLAAAGLPLIGAAASECSHAAAAAPAADRAGRAPGVPGDGAPGATAAAHRHGPDCRMFCCVARPAAASCVCRCSRSQPRQQASFAAGMPSILPAPPRLPLPRSAALDALQARLPAALPFLGLPERPPRA